MVNVNRLKGKIVENGLTIKKLAESIGINKSTLYRKLQKDGSSITIRDANLISKELNLSADEVNTIFFNQFVA